MKKSVIFLAVTLLIAGCSNNNVTTDNITTTSHTTTTNNIEVTTTTNTTTPNITSSTTTQKVTTPTPSTSVVIPSTPTPSTPVPTTPTPSTPTIIELEVPSLVLDEETGVVSWNAIPSATHYNYIINDGEVKTTTATTITLEDKTNISVQAASSESISKWSYAVTYYDTSDIFIETKEDINVYFHGTNYEPLSLKEGDLVTKPNNPEKEFYIFDNWYIDPFHEQLFDFNTPVYEDTIIYASFNKEAIIDNVYFWIKANDLITSTTQEYYSDSSWKFIPLTFNNHQTTFKEFKATIEVRGASTTTHANFVILDGFKADDGRNYWKDNGNDFAITSDGIYDIYFSAEHEYYTGINAYIATSNNTALTMDALEIKNTLSTPIVIVDSENNIARWDHVKGANEYEVILNNLSPTTTTNNYITLNKNTHISVRAKNENETSSWSIPKANINISYEQEEVKTTAFVYFLDTYLDAYEVSLNTEISSPNDPIIEGTTFEGWYLDISLKEKATFPYVVTKDTVFYPKYTFEENVLTKDYYYLTDESGNRVKGLTWNLDNFDFYEYETGKVSLTANAKYYIKRIDNSKSWGPYTVNTTGSYKIYFSEEHLWAIDTEKERNIYIESVNITIYFTNNYRWSNTIYAYAWNSESGKFKKSWPGTAMEVVKTNSYGETIYKINLDKEEFNYIIFNNGSGNQTIDIDISSAYSGLGYYINGGSGKSHTVGTYDYQ